MASYDRKYRRFIEDWGDVVSTDVIPDGESRWYDGVTGYQSSEIIELTGNGSSAISALNKQQIMTDGAQTIYGNKTFDGSVTAAVVPPVGYTYVQYPFDSTPLALYGGGTWVDISQKAKGYELSVSGWVSREAVGQTLYTETDYEATDTISGGTYDGETVSTVFTFTGQTIRFSGGKAETFEEGTQLDASQRITGTIGNIKPISDGTDSCAGVFTVDSTASGSGDSGSSGPSVVDFDSADSSSPNTAKTDDDETRMTNFTVRAWKRTA